MMTELNNFKYCSRIMEASTRAACKSTLIGCCQYQQLIQMGFYHFILNYLKSSSIPVFKSFFNAYKHTTAGAKEEAGAKKHPIDDFFKSMLSKTNLAAPPIDVPTSLLILNIEKKGDKQIDPWHILERYYTLYKKNDPEQGGTVYLQSKVFAAKECLMSEIPNASEIEEKFYKEVVEPQEKAAEEEGVQSEKEPEGRKQSQEEKQKK